MTNTDFDRVERENACSLPTLIFGASNEHCNRNVIRVLFCCTGVGILNRGIETFFREAFDGLKGLQGMDGRLISGVVTCTPERKAEEPTTPVLCERSVWCLKRTGRIASLVGKLTGRSAYTVEQWSSLPGVALEIRRFRPHVVFTSEANLMFLLHRFRRQIGVPFCTLFSNGGPCHPPFDRHNFVHQVAPFYLQEALQAGEPSERHFLVPYGIGIPDRSVLQANRSSIRRALDLPLDRKIVLSVGWIAREHKRMHYVIEEMAQMPEPRPFLQLLGAIDEKSPEIIALGEQLLGEGNFSAKSVPYQEVGRYYQAADCFVLASLKEGFGRVYLESLLHGLPTIGHRHPVIEYVLGDVGIVTDLSTKGSLATEISKALAMGHDPAQALRRWQNVRARFSWETLRPQYLEMFREAAGMVK